MRLFLPGLARARHEAKRRSGEAAKRRSDCTPPPTLGATAGGGPWADSCQSSCLSKAVFRAALLSVCLTSPSLASVEASGTVGNGELIRCPDWERLMPPVILANAREGQTREAFEARAGRPAPAPAGATPSESCTHTVAAGDTLGQISADKLGTAQRWREIMTLNPGLKPNELRPWAGTKTSMQRRRRGRGRRRGNSSRPRHLPGSPAEGGVKARARGAGGPSDRAGREFRWHGRCARPVRRQSRQAHHLCGGKAARHRACAPRPSRLPLHDGRRRCRNRLRDARRAG